MSQSSFTSESSGDSGGVDESFSGVRQELSDKSTSPVHSAPVVPDVTKAPVTLADANSEDVELWLMRVPPHQVLRNGLVGKEIVLDDPRAQNSVRGSYSFTDHGLSNLAKSVRAAFATQVNGESVYRIGPAFSRQVNVTFVGSMVDEVNDGPPSKVYPEVPPNLSVKYRPIGPHAMTPAFECKKQNRNSLDSEFTDLVKEGEGLDVTLDTNVEDTVSPAHIPKRESISVVKNERKLELPCANDVRDTPVTCPPHVSSTEKGRKRKHKKAKKPLQEDDLLIKSEALKAGICEGKTEVVVMETTTPPSRSERSSKSKKKEARKEKLESMLIDAEDAEIKGFHKKDRKRMRTEKKKLKKIST